MHVYTDQVFFFHELVALARSWNIIILSCIDYDWLYLVIQSGGKYLDRSSNFDMIYRDRRTCASLEYLS